MGVKVYLRKSTSVSKDGQKGYYLLSTHYGYKLNAEGKKVQDRKFENLKLVHYYKPKNAEQKAINKLSRNKAEQIRIDRENQFINSVHKLRDTQKITQDFYEYYDKIVNSRAVTKSNRSSYINAKKKLIAFRGENIRVTDIDYPFCRDFYSFLNKTTKKNGEPLSSQTKSSYFKHLRVVCQELNNDGLLNTNPALKVNLGKVTNGETTWLTQKEIQKLINTDCRTQVIKDAYLVACFTGLRSKNLKKLKWRDYIEEDGKLVLKAIVVKSQKPVSIPVDENLKIILDRIGRKGDDDLILNGLNLGGYTNTILKEWGLIAGVKKSLKFHSGRHSFGVQFIRANGNLNVLKTLMGHSNVNSTMRYVNIVDTHKFEEMDKMPKYKFSK
jgi:integrase/recombinase XerD